MHKTILLDLLTWLHNLGLDIVDMWSALSSKLYCVNGNKCICTLPSSVKVVNLKLERMALLGGFLPIMLG